MHFKSPAIPNCQRNWDCVTVPPRIEMFLGQGPFSLRPFLVAWPTPILESIFLFLNKKSLFLSILICPWSNCPRTHDPGSLSEYTLDLIRAYHLRTTKFSEIYVLVCTGFWFWFWFFLNESRCICLMAIWHAKARKRILKLLRTKASRWRKQFGF